MKSDACICSCEWPEYFALHWRLPLHANVVTLLGLCPDCLRENSNDGVFTIIMLLYGCSSMHDYVARQRQLPLTGAELFVFALPMAKAVAHLHTHFGDHHYIQKDLARRNFVLTADREPFFIDFRMAQTCSVSRDH